MGYIKCNLDKESGISKVPYDVKSCSLQLGCECLPPAVRLSETFFTCQDNSAKHLVKIC